MLLGVDAVATAVRLVLAAVLVLAAGAKLLDAHGTRTALGEFGVRADLARPLARVVPAVELAIAIGLTIDRTATVSGALAAALMLAFGVAIARVLRQGVRPDCNCFGQLGSAPIAWGALVRNALLGAAGVFVAARGPGDAIPAWLVAAALAAVCALLVRNRRARGRDVPVPRVGEPAPSVSGRDVHGRQVSLDRVLASGRPAAVVFVSADCGPCKGLLPELERWHAALGERLALLTVDELPNAFGVTSTPSALIVTPDGIVASGTATGVAGVESLVRAELSIDREM